MIKNDLDQFEAALIRDGGQSTVCHASQGTGDPGPPDPGRPPGCRNLFGHGRGGPGRWGP